MIWAVVGLGLALVGSMAGLLWAWRTVRLLQGELVEMRARLEAGRQLVQELDRIDRDTKEKLNGIEKEKKARPGNPADDLRDFFK